MFGMSTADWMELQAYRATGLTPEAVQEMVSFPYTADDEEVTKMIANQCVVCGAEMPEGDQVCRWCRDGIKEEREMTPEERLLRAIFTKSEQGEQDELDEMPDNYPETYFEKADYAMFCMHKSLASISPALGRISRLCGLLRVSEKDGKNTLPDIITQNESRMALKHLAMVKRDVDDAYQEILSIFESTKEPETVSETESVGQGPEPGVEVE